MNIIEMITDYLCSLHSLVFCFDQMNIPFVCFVLGLLFVTVHRLDMSFRQEEIFHLFFWMKSSNPRGKMALHEIWTKLKSQFRPNAFYSLKNPTIATWLKPDCLFIRLSHNCSTYRRSKIPRTKKPGTPLDCSN